MRASYDRTRLSAGIVHVGVGGFHRSHQAMYLDRLMRAGLAFDWAICGVGALETDRRMHDVLEAQEHLYTLVEKHADGGYVPRTIGSIVDHIHAPDDPAAVVERLADERTRIVSLTITEGGYEVDGPTFGLVTEALVRRRARGLTPFTVVSCDNLEGNGRVAREAFTSFARLRDPGLADWILEEVCFPSSMVDRITPATTDGDRQELRARFGIDDRWPVVCEPFVQWVLEDSFSCGRPPLEQAGVQIVDDVEPYERMKLRLLNASHQGLCYFGRLCGYDFVHEVAADPLFIRFLRGYMDEEASPTLDSVIAADLDSYKDSVLERFANREIRDTLDRIATDASDRIPKFLLPVIRSRLACGGKIARSAAVVASWARYTEGVDERGQPIEVVDRQGHLITALAGRQRDDPLAFIRDREVFGDLADHEPFARAYLWTLQSLRERGTRRTLETIVQTHG